MSSFNSDNDKVQIQLNKKDIEWLKDASENIGSWMKSIVLLLLAQLLGGFGTLIFFLLKSGS